MSAVSKRSKSEQHYCTGCGDPILTRQGRKLRCGECEAKKKAEADRARKKRKSEDKPHDTQ